jgi:dTDP-4-amino-4,6-dideoxygalactose transaminase
MSALAIEGGRPIRTTPFPPQNTIGEEEKNAVMEVLASGNLSQFLGEWSEDFLGGPRVREAERAYAERLGARHAISVNSATTGLHVALAAAGVGPGDEVIVSPFTMSASAAVAVLQNAVPVFADIEDETYGLDPAAVEVAITPYTRAIMVTHIFGHPARMNELCEIAERHGLAIVEDAAQSIGATHDGRQTGTIGTAGVLSLNYHKIIHSGEGGIVLTDDDDLALIAQLSRNHGEVVADQVELPSITNTIGSNFRMTEVEAAIARTQLDKLDGLLERRRALAARLTERLDGIDGVRGATTADGCTHSFYVYALRLEGEVLEAVSRETVVRALAAEGIPVSNGYVTPLYLQPMYQQRIGRGARGCPWTCGHWQGEVSYAPGICPVTERLHERELMLADVTRSPLQERDVDDVADALEKVLGDTDALRRIAAEVGV